MKTETQNKDMHLSDEEIIELYWNRKETAIMQTDRKYGQFLFTIAYNVLHDRLDGEECVNDTYLGVWNRIPPTRPNVFKAFIAKIAQNIAIDRYRSKASDKRVPTEMTISLEELNECLSVSSTVEEDYAIQELGRLINDYLHGLEDRETFIFVCRYYFSDQIATIARMQGVSEATVYKTLATLRRQLREKLEQEGYLNGTQG